MARATSQNIVDTWDKKPHFSLWDQHFIVGPEQWSISETLEINLLGSTKTKAATNICMTVFQQCKDKSLVCIMWPLNQSCHRNLIEGFPGNNGSNINGRGQQRSPGFDRGVNGLVGFWGFLEWLAGSGRDLQVSGALAGPWMPPSALIYFHFWAVEGTCERYGFAVSFHAN